MELLQAARRAGAASIVTVVLRRAWSTRTWLGLRCDLSNLPPVRPASVPVAMQPLPCPGFDGFAREAEQVSGEDALEMAQRVRMCAEGVTTLYVARAHDGRPIYAQWLISAAEQRPLHRYAPGLFPPLEADEALVEGAYTFVDFRKRGAMADGMAQLLAAARVAGARSVITYVLGDNVPSLRGCANVGFTADHVRVTTRRLGRRRSVRQPLDERALAQWHAAIAR